MTRLTSGHWVTGMLLVLVAGSGPARATEYFVDNSGACSDTGPGTEAEPWCSIQQAARSFSAGDVVQVKPGTYDGPVSVTASGSAGAPIVLRSHTRRAATIRGAVAVRGAYARLEGFNVEKTSRDYVSAISASGEHGEILDNYIANVPQATSIVATGTGTRVARNTVYMPQYGIVVAGTGVTIEENEVDGLRQWDSAGDCDYMRFFGSDHVIRGNYFHGMRSADIGTAHVDCFQTFDNNGEFAANIMFENNICVSFHQGLMGEAMFYGNSHDLTFRNNVFVNSGAWGLAVVDIPGVYAYNNVFANIQYHGIGCSGTTACVVVNNIFYNADTGYWASDGGTVTGHHNLLYKTTGTYSSAQFPNDILNRDPLFIGGGDYHLQAGSPAVDSGADLSGTGFAYDAEGTSRPQGVAWDIGAYELVQPSEPCATLGGNCCMSGESCSSGVFGASTDCGNLCCVGGTCRSTCQSLGFVCCDACQSGPQPDHDADCGGQVCCQACVPPPAFEPEQCVEAEAGSLVSPMAAASEASASGGSYMHTTAANQGSVSFDFDITQAGDYIMQAAVLTPSGSDAHNSFWVGVDAEPAQGDDAYAYDTLLTTTYAWDNVSLRGSGGPTTPQYDPKAWTLGAGRHRFTFYGREDGTRLDQVALRACPAPGGCAAVAPLDCQSVPPLCPDGQCEADSGENCATCPADCPTGAGEVCCAGELFAGDCCTTGDCPPPEVCTNHVCAPGTCADADGDGHTDAACGGEDCNDGNRDVHPGAAEACGDGVDNDCDGETDEECDAVGGCSCGAVGSEAMTGVVWVLLLVLAGLACHRNPSLSHRRRS